MTSMEVKLDLPNRQFDARVSRDADDDAVLACAQAARAELIVGGVDDLLVLQQFEEIPILDPAQALRHLTAAKSRRPPPP